jgi:hypothetical protein
VAVASVDRADRRALRGPPGALLGGRGVLGRGGAGPGLSGRRQLEVGEDGAHHRGVLDGGDDPQVSRAVLSAVGRTSVPRTSR